jgi:hypothetical protein
VTICGARGRLNRETTVANPNTDKTMKRNIERNVIVITGTRSRSGESTLRHLTKLGVRVVVGGRRKIVSMHLVKTFRPMAPRSLPCRPPFSIRR